jgi:hypothetical protein
MKAMPTMPSPITTTLFRSEGGFGYFEFSSSELCPLAGSLLIAIPGEEVDHDIGPGGCVTRASMRPVLVPDSVTPSAQLFQRSQCLHGVRFAMQEGQDEDPLGRERRGKERSKIWSAYTKYLRATYIEQSESAG